MSRAKYVNFLKHIAAANAAGLCATTFSVVTSDKYWSFIGRVDYQTTAKNQLSVRTSFWNYHNPNTGYLTTSYPNACDHVHRYDRSVFGTWSRVIHDNIVQEVKAGYHTYYWKTDLDSGVQPTPYHSFPAAQLNVGPTSFYPESFWEKTPSVHYGLAWHAGTHDIKFGAEDLIRTDYGYWPNNQRGSILFTGVPTDIPLAQRFPLADWNNPSAWNLTGLDPLALSVTQNFSNNWNIRTPRKEYAIWMGNTWHTFPRLTFTYGLRWDV
ncbi:MAG TPA: hypothetical protein VH640_01005 [Bryobacteraceae bacterium]